MLPFAFFACQFLAAQYALGFNLDVKNAIVLEGRTGSYFGFSVALVNNTAGAWLLGGAPLDKIGQRSDDGPAGALYKCPIIPVDEERACNKVPLSQTGSGPAGILNIGTSVDMQPIIKDKVVYCGYQVDPRSGHPSNATINGLCYELLQDLDYRRSSRIAPLTLGRGNIGDKDGQFLDSDNADRILYFPIHNSEGNTMLVGTPASQNGKGAVVLYRGNRRLKRKVFPQRGGFAGYSVSSGRLFRDPRLYYVVGAPGTSDTGKVYILGDGLDIILELSGEQDGSYFGAAISVVDINGDGLDDVIVGAPLYSQRKEEGAVYVYLNKNEEPLKKMEPLLMGSNSPGAKFGSAIQNIGDMNRDSFEDVAIGAPYEDNGKGAIYIYNGRSEETGLGTYTQRIAARDLPGGMDFQGFGMSFSRVSDVDGNSYGDLAVGAPRSDSAVVIRGRPVVDLQPRFRVTPAVIDPAVKTCRYKDQRATCLRIEVCFVFRGYSLPSFLDVEFTLHSDTLKGGSRIQLMTDDGLYSGRNGTIRVSRRRTACQKYNGIVLPQAAADIFTPVQFNLTFDLPGAPSSTEGSIKAVDPVLTAFLAKSESTQVQFQKNCGADNLCQSDLVTTARVAYPESKPYLLVGADESLRLEVNVLNSGEAAYLSTVIITYTDNVEFLSDPRSPVHCQVNTGEFRNVSTDPKNRKQVMCEVGNPLETSEDKTFTVIFDARRLSPKSSPIEFITDARTASDDTNMDNNVRKSQAIVRFQADTRLSGVSNPGQVSLVRGSPDPESNEKKITHIHDLRNAANTVLSRAAVIFTIPVGNLTSGEVLLDRVEADGSDKSRSKCKVLSGGQNSSKEETATHMPDMDTMLSDRDSSSKCSDGSCYTIKCTIKDLGSQQSILFRSVMRLMPSVLDEIAGDEFQVATMAEVLIPGNTIFMAAANRKHSVMTRVIVEEYVEPETTPEHEPAPEGTAEPGVGTEAEPDTNVEPEADESEGNGDSAGSTRTIIPLLVILSLIANIIL